MSDELELADAEKRWKGRRISVRDAHDGMVIVGTVRNVRLHAGIGTDPEPEIHVVDDTGAGQWVLPNHPARKIDLL